MSEQARADGLIRYVANFHSTRQSAGIETITENVRIRSLWNPKSDQRGIYVDALGD